jgi:hypothetical protein
MVHVLINRECLPEKLRVRLAKTLSHVGGRLYKSVKLYKRYYLVVGHPETGELLTRRAGRRWQAPSLAIKLGLEWPEKLDREHYSHWAIWHAKSCVTRCETCGGSKCDASCYDGESPPQS